MSVSGLLRKWFPVGLLGHDLRKFSIYGAFLGRGSHVSYLKVDLGARFACSCSPQSTVLGFLGQRIRYSVLAFPSHGELFQHEVLFYMACPTFPSHSRRYLFVLHREGDLQQDFLLSLHFFTSTAATSKLPTLFARYFGLTSRSLQSSTRPFAGYSIALYFPCPPVPIAFHFLSSTFNVAFRNTGTLV